MNRDRYVQLMRNFDLELTDEERLQGWHFCWDWGSLLVGPGMENELEHCCCQPNRPEELKQ